MKRLLTALFLLVTVVSCHFNAGRTIRGNGRMATEERAFNDITKIRVRGAIHVEVVPGHASLKVEADDNLLPYIETRQENGWMVIRTKNNVSLRSQNPIRVYVSTDMLNAVDIAGSSVVKGQGKFSGAGYLDIDIAGSGNVDLAVNTPRIKVDISGSGSVVLSGETKDAAIDISGSGNYRAEELMTETTDIDISGSGEASVNAADKLSADVFGSGTVFYRGNPDVRSNTAGSGRVKRIP